MDIIAIGSHLLYYLRALLAISCIILFMMKRLVAIASAQHTPAKLWPIRALD